MPSKSKSNKSKKSKSSKTKTIINDDSKQKVEKLDTKETVVDFVETSDNEDVKNVETVSPTEVIVEKTLVSRIDHHISTLQEIKKLISTELKEVQELRKIAKQETKKKKRKKSGGSNKPNNSGIMRKFKIPKKLSKFMGTDIASRVDALKFISAYARDNDLQDEDDKRFIDLDDKLESVFPVLKGKEGKERLCFTSIMTHISSYFPKKGTEDYDKMVVIEDEIETLTEQ
jgi:chromatin remodeling complex protein RSC6